MQNVNYRNTKAVSNSIMGIYEDDFKSFVRYWVDGIPFPERKDDALTMGSVIDTLLTTPEEFNHRFITYQGEAPRGQMLTFCNALASLPGKMEDNYQAAYNTVGYKRKSDTLEVIIGRFQPYIKFYEYSKQSGSKTVLTLDQINKATTIVEELTWGTYTRKFTNAKTTDTKTVYNQLELFTHRLGIPVKGALDRVIVDHENKTVQPLDFKSSYNVEEFPTSYVKWRYYRQGSFYTDLLGDWMGEQGLSDYTILPFIFIVCSTSGGKHYLYEQSQNDIEKAKVGGELTNGTRVKGWEEILNELNYLTNTDWEFPYNAVINRGLIPLNIFK
jgi:hypothetical protein